MTDGMRTGEGLQISYKMWDVVNLLTLRIYRLKVLGNGPFGLKMVLEA
jgi:hypothetical protein